MTAHLATRDASETCRELTKAHTGAAAAAAATKATSTSLVLRKAARRHAFLSTYINNVSRAARDALRGSVRQQHHSQQKTPNVFLAHNATSVYRQDQTGSAFDKHNASMRARPRRERATARRM